MFADTGHWSQANHYNSTAGNQSVNWTDGTVYQYRGADKSQRIYLWCLLRRPIFKDRLFIYVNAERGTDRLRNINPIYSRVNTLTSATNKAQAWREARLLLRVRP